MFIYVVCIIQILKVISNYSGQINLVDDKPQYLVLMLYYYYYKKVE